MKATSKPYRPWEGKKVEEKRRNTHSMNISWAYLLTTDCVPSTGLGARKISPSIYDGAILRTGFPGSSVGKEFACNAGDPSSIPGLGRSPREGKGYLLQYSWAFLVVQLVKNPSAIQETPVRSLGWEDPQEKGKATHSSTLAWRIPRTI